MTMFCRGVRGATTVDANTKEAIVEATRELLDRLVEANDLDPADVGSIFFTATPDLDAEFPAVAARDLGLQRVPLLCTREVPVPGSLPRVIRVLLHYYAPEDHEPRHVYLGEARALRADLESAQ